MTGSVLASPALPWAAAAGVRPAGPPAVSDQLTALARMAQTGFARAGQDGFSPALLREAEALLGRAGERLRLSAGHTVVVLAGGTGSGKSSLFNCLAGADFSPAGVVRPTTRDAYACVWGMRGAGPLLEWLGVTDRNRYARSSALDEGERALDGLLLLDLPDHDSVLTGASGAAGRLVTLADLIIWVLDPQKYADASVHRRYLAPMAGHSSVIAVVLNQADLLSREQADDCVADLHRLLESEGLHDSPVLLTSAATGAGLAELRETLAATVSARRASTERIVADVAALAARFADYAGEPDTAAHTAREEALVTAFSQAAGVPGVASALQSARELRAADYLGWPVSWLADRVLRRDPVRSARLGTLWEELRGVSAGPAGAHRAEIDNAVTAFADQAGAGLPAPWPASTRSAARSRVEEIPAALGAVIARALPAENAVTPWWRLAAAWQGLLLGVAGAGLIWFVTLLVVGVFHAARHPAGPFGDVGLLPWVAGAVAAVLLAGWLSAHAGLRLVVRSAHQERERAERDMRSGIGAVAQELVIGPVDAEISVCAQFREELAIATGKQ